MITSTMAYPERQLIYQTFKMIAENILKSKVRKDLAEAELKVLVKEITEVLKSISLAEVLKSFQIPDSSLLIDLKFNVPRCIPLALNDL